MVKIAVLGAGVNGLACAVKIKEKYKSFQVNLISSEFTPNTTGDGSGGLWCPYQCGNTPSELLRKWGGQTFEYLRELCQSGDVNICCLPYYKFYTKPENITKPSWTKVVDDYRELDSNQMERFNNRFSSKFVAGISFTTFVTPPSALLTYFERRFKEAGGKIIRAKVTSLRDPILRDYDVVVNCTGLGARYLVPDEKVVPIRGQIIKVKAPWLKEVIMNDVGQYIIPNVDVCILGGTNTDSFNTTVDTKDSDHIMNECKKMLPSLKNAKIVGHWVGLRPGRTSVRLEPEVSDGKLIIHNYGHGGSGFTLFWGCSSDVLQILDTHLNKQQLRSKI